MGKVIMSGVVPQLGNSDKPGPSIALSEIAIGSIIKVNENGSPVEYYIAQRNYEEALNGSGRTLLVRKPFAEKKTQPDAKEWLTSTFVESLDAGVQSIIGETKHYQSTFYYDNSDDGDSGYRQIDTESAAAFLLSVYEFGKMTFNSRAGDGTILPIASILRKTPSADDWQWTRSETNHWNGANAVQYESPGVSEKAKNSYMAYFRPAFTVPESAVINSNTLILKGGS